MNLLTMEHITKAYTDRVLLNDVAFSINENEKIGVIGINGMGKSTLLKVAAGIEPYDEGKISIGNQVKICYLPQTPEFEEGTTVLRAAIADNVNELNQWTIEADARSMLNKLGFYDYDEKVEHMSGGQKKRIALVNALLTPADILVLDEPTNHLDAESIDWLEQHLQQYTGTVICITHDRYFLDHVAGWILELDRGEGIPWKGNYSSWLDQKTKRMAQEEKQASKRRKTLERELEWINMAPKARQAKGKARLNSYEALLNEDQKEREAKLEIFIPNGP